MEMYEGEAEPHGTPLAMLPVVEAAKPPWLWLPLPIFIRNQLDGLLVSKSAIGSAGEAPAFRVTSSPGAPPTPPHPLCAAEAKTSVKVIWYVGPATMPSAGSRRRFINMKR